MRLSLNPPWEFAPFPLSFRYDCGKAFTPNKILWPELKRPGVARPGIFFAHNERFCDKQFVEDESFRREVSDIVYSLTNQ